MVLVHHREVKGNINRIKETEEAVPYSQETEPNSEMDSSVPFCFLLNNYKATSQSTDTTGLNSAQALEHVDTESAGNHQASSGFHPCFKLQQPMVEKFNAGFTDPSFPGPISDDYQGNFPTISGVDFASLTSADTNGVLPEQENPILGDLFISNFGETWEFGNHPQIQKDCQTSEGKWPLDQNVHEESACNYQTSSGFHSLFELQQPMVEKINAGLTDPYFPGPISDDYQGKFPTISGVDFASLTQADKAKDGNNAALKILDFPLWEDVLGNGTSGTQAVTFEPSFLETKPDTTGVLSKQENPILGQHFTSNLGEMREIGTPIWKSLSGPKRMAGF